MRLFISLMAGALAATPAFACSPAPFEAGTSAAGKACGMVYFDEEYTARGLGDADELGGGFVAQAYAEGNGCYAEASMVVIDCTLGQAVIFGPGSTDSPMLSEEERAAKETEPFEVLRSAIEDAATVGTPLSLAEISARAGGDFINNAVVDVTTAIGISNDETAPLHSYDLGCACRLYYPGSTGAGQ